MTEIRIPVDVHFDLLGNLDIPAGSTIIVNDEGSYSGFFADNGDWFSHRGHPAPEDSAEAQPKSKQRER